MKNFHLSGQKAASANAAAPWPAALEYRLAKYLNVAASYSEKPTLTNSAALCTISDVYLFVIFIPIINSSIFIYNLIFFLPPPDIRFQNIFCVLRFGYHNKGPIKEYTQKCNEIGYNHNTPDKQYKHKNIQNKNGNLGIFQYHI